MAVAVASVGDASASLNVRPLSMLLCLPACSQFGFVMIVGVLLDTFVVRTILVPAILSLGGWLNWWPAAMPKVEVEDE